MAVQFILGRAGTGKTRLMLEQIHHRLMEEPCGSPLIYLVPEQATFQAEYELVNKLEVGAMFRAQVLSFGRLAYRLLQEVGGAALLAVDDLGKQMALRLLLEKHRQQLRLFHRSAQQPGFVEQLSRLISECKRYGVGADDLALEQNGTLEDKLHDLRLIMQAYEQYLGEQYYDTDDMLTKVAGKLADSHYIRQAEIWIDGFSGFTKQEYLIVQELMKQARRVTIALCVDPNKENRHADELELFFPTIDTYQRLRSLANEAGVEVEEPICLLEGRRFADSPRLAHLERYYFQWEPSPSAPTAQRPDEICLVTAANRRAEVQAVALRMLSLARDQQYRWRDMTVLVREAGMYTDEIKSIFAEYGIPFFLDEKRAVMHHPLVELIRSALEVITSRWRYEAVFRCLKTDLCSPDDKRPLAQQRAEVDLLENYVLAYGLYGNDWTTEQRWQFHNEDAVEYQEIDEIRWRYGEPLAQFEREMKQAAKVNVRAMSTALYQFLSRLRVAQKLEQWQQDAEREADLEAAREHGQVWNGVMELLDQVVEVLGEEQIDIGTFARVLDSGLESIRLGLVPPALDQVVVGTMERSRQPDVKAVFLLGVNEGIIPLRPQEGGVLDETERERLLAAGIELAPSANRRLLAEQYLLYVALTRASERLWISCALADEEGKGLLPSPVFRRMRDLLPDLEIRFFAGEPTGNLPDDLELLGNQQTTFAHLLALLRRWKEGKPLPPLWQQVYQWFASRQQNLWRERWLLAGLRHTNSAYLPSQTSQALYGDKLKLSVSRLEQFQVCPFSHFAAYGLKLRQRPLYKLERFDVGELFHASMKRAVERMNEQQLSWAEVTEAIGMKLADEVVEELIPVTRSSILSRTARYRFLSRSLKRDVGRAIAVLGEYAKRSKFVPIGLEVAFGPGGELPGLTVTLANGITLQLIGRIDRVDQSVDSEQTFLCVIDYKSGAKKLLLSDVWYGLNLQLLVYLDVVVTHAEQWLGKKAEPGGVFYFQVADPFITAKRLLTADELARERAKKLKMKGLMLKDTRLARLMDSYVESGSSELLPFGLKKDGSFSARSAVATRDQFQVLQSYVRQTIQQTSERLTDGEIVISPYLQNGFTACQICDYKAVCQFDQAFAGNQLRPLITRPDEFIWEHLLQKEQQREDERKQASEEQDGEGDKA